MEKTVVQTSAAPAPIGPYNQAILTGGFLFISGQVAINPASGELVMDTIEEETEQVMQNLKSILSIAGFDFGDIVKTTIFLSDMNLFTAVNGVYGSHFTGAFPARETVAVKGLPKNANVEISMIAAKS
jgi:2-iminobutanoate/2-iminopropanoate deaminase